MASTLDSPDADRGHDPLAAIRIANYRAFAVGFVCSGLALQMLGAAVLWEIHQRTHDPLQVGYVGLVRALPVVLLVLVSGHVVDRYSRRAVLAITSFGFAACGFVMAYLSICEAPLGWVYLTLALTGVCRAFNGPSRNALLPQLVPEAIFHNAVTWNSGLFQFSAISGPLLFGLLYWLCGRIWPVYVATGLLCSAFGVIALFLRPAPGGLSKEPLTMAAVLAGIRHILRERIVLSAITLDLLAVLFGGVTALLPFYAEEVLGAGPMGYGVLKAAPYAGALVMAIIMAYRPPIARAGRALLWSVAIYGLTIIVFGLSGSFWLSLAALAVGGAVDNISVVVRHVLVPTRTPDALRGRVNAVNSVFIECSNELGSYESGLVARVFSPMISAVSGGVISLLVVAGVAYAFPELRRLGSLKDIPPPPPG